MKTMYLLAVFFGFLFPWSLATDISPLQTWALSDTTLTGVTRNSYSAYDPTSQYSDCIFTWGGNVCTDCNTMFCYNITNDDIFAWGSMDSSISQKYIHSQKAAFILNDIIYFITSNDGKIYTYDLTDTSQMEQLTTTINVELPALIKHPNGHQYYALDGNDAGSYPGAFYVYDIQTTVISQNDINIARYRPVVIVNEYYDDPYLYVISGDTEYIERLNLNDAVNNNWETLQLKLGDTQIGVSLSLPHQRGVVANFRNFIYIIGGYSASSFDDEENVFYLDVKNWDIEWAGEFPIGISRFTGVMAKNRVYTFGGYTTDNTDTDAIYISNDLTEPTPLPTILPTNIPSKIPSSSPTNIPSIPPTKLPSTIPSQSQTNNPSSQPVVDPTKSPSDQSPPGPTGRMTDPPTKVPSDNPSKSPTEKPSDAPVKNPTLSPISLMVTSDPTEPPTKSPIDSAANGDGNGNGNSNNKSSNSSFSLTNDGLPIIAFIGIIVIILGCCVCIMLAIFWVISYNRNKIKQEQQMALQNVQLMKSLSASNGQNGQNTGYNQSPRHQLGMMNSLGLMQQNSNSPLMTNNINTSIMRGELMALTNPALASIDDINNNGGDHGVDELYMSNDAVNGKKSRYVKNIAKKGNNIGVANGAGGVGSGGVELVELPAPPAIQPGNLKNDLIGVGSGINDNDNVNNKDNVEVVLNDGSFVNYNINQNKDNETLNLEAGEQAD